jgi:4-hydroxybenzoate polyprenyltransferase
MKLLRGFPYGRYLITVFPVFAILIHNGLISSPWSFSLIFPFIFIIAAGFTYNAICDADKDPIEKNVIASGNFRKNYALILLVSLIIISLGLFLIIYTSKVSLFFFILYIILWLTYSGLYVRFKESVLAPIIASIVLWVGAPFVILTEYQYFNFDTTVLILGLFFVYIGHEIKHTTVEYDLDLSYNCKTFAVRFGKKYATLMEYIAIIIGYTFLSIGAYRLLDNFIFTIIFALIFLISMISTISYGYKVNYDLSKDLIFITLPYSMTILFIIAYSCIQLQLPLLLTMFVMWIFLINKN